MPNTPSHSSKPFSLLLEIPEEINLNLRRAAGWPGDQGLRVDIIRRLTESLAMQEPSQKAVRNTTSDESICQDEINLQTAKQIADLQSTVDSLIQAAKSTNQHTDRLIGIVEKQSNHIESIMAVLSSKGIGSNLH